MSVTRLDLKFWTLIASQDTAWLERCQGLSELAASELRLRDIADEPTIEF